MNEVTRILSAIEQGDPIAGSKLLTLVYDELRELAAQKLAREQPGQTLEATALVHEAYVNDLGFSPDGSRLVTASFDNTLKLWDVASGQEVLELSDEIGFVRVRLHGRWEADSRGRRGRPGPSPGRELAGGAPELEWCMRRRRSRVTTCWPTDTGLQTSSSLRCWPGTRPHRV